MILDEILAHKRIEVAERKAARPVSALIAAINAGVPEGSPPGTGGAEDVHPPNPVAGSDHVTDISSGKAWVLGRFAHALRQPGVAIIAEIKRKSPSGGELRPGASAAELAQTYAANGAAALSVLTDAHYFGGSDADLVDARNASGLPTLRKDFVVDAYQLYEARAIGADAILLIVRSLSDAKLRDLLALASDLALDALVETHSADEVKRALNAGARVIGVNNRDLDTLVTDVSLAPRLRALVPPECVFVAESGISQPEQITHLHEAGVNAVLVGESLVRAPDPGAKLRTLVEAGAARTVAR